MFGESHQFQPMARHLVLHSTELGDHQLLLESPLEAWRDPDLGSAKSDPPLVHLLILHLLLLLFPKIEPLRKRLSSHALLYVRNKNQDELF